MSQNFPCPSCGDVNPADAVFCGGCGTKLDSAKTVTASAPTETVVAPTSPPELPRNQVSAPAPTPLLAQRQDPFAQSLLNAVDDDGGDDESLDPYAMPGAAAPATPPVVPAAAPQSAPAPRPTPPAPRPTPPQSAPASAQPTFDQAALTNQLAQMAAAMSAPVVAAAAPIVYDYTMVQLPPNIEVRGRSNGQEAAQYLQNICNQYANEKWEFYRVDTVGVMVSPGCLATLFGQRASFFNYYVVTFRRPRRG